MYCPQRGDLVWLAFDPQAAHEQSGRRPALVLSPKDYNQTTGLAIFCPVSSREKGYVFEVRIPAGHTVAGVVLADQVKSLDWKSRQARFVSRAPDEVVAEVMGKLGVLLVMGRQA